MKAKEIIRLMDKWAPKDLIDTWDNTGFQIGNAEKEVSKVLIGLDLDKKLYKMALEGNYHMIITHHPVIFSPLKSIVSWGGDDNLIYNLIKNDIVAFSAHTNLDRAENGVNHVLADLLGLTNQERLENTNGPDEMGYGIAGNIGRIDLEEYLWIIKEKLETDHLIVYGDMERKINRVALCGGSGSDFIRDAFEAKADIYITGDIKYHEAQMATNLGLTLIDPGHYHTEKVILPVIKDYLMKEAKEGLEINIWNRPSPEYRIF